MRSKSTWQFWKHLFTLGAVLGTFYAGFVVGVRWLENSWLQQPNLTLGGIATIFVMWSAVIPLIISAVVTAIRTFFLVNPPDTAGLPDPRP